LIKCVEGYSAYKENAVHDVN